LGVASGRCARGTVPVQPYFFADAWPSCMRYRKHK